MDGHSLVQHGNLVEVGTGIIGIDEACSGVRSLQSALMLSLFLGEMNRFSLAETALLGASLVFVVVANIARTTFLVWTGANHGMRQVGSLARCRRDADYADRIARPFGPRPFHKTQDFEQCSK